MHCSRNSHYIKNIYMRVLWLNIELLCIFLGSRQLEKLLFRRGLKTSKKEVLINQQDLCNLLGKPKIYLGCETRPNPVPNEPWPILIILSVSVSLSLSVYLSLSLSLCLSLSLSLTQRGALRVKTFIVIAMFSSGLLQISKGRWTVVIYISFLK